MSKTAAIVFNFHLSTNIKFVDIFNDFFKNNWSANKRGYIVFMLNGTFDWESSPFVNFDKIIRQIENSLQNKHETAIDLIWKDNITTIGLLFTNENLIAITISENIKK